MNVDLDQGTDPDQPADDIRSQLEASFTEAESGAADKTTPAAGKTATEDDVDPTAASTGERVRGPDGKFLKKDETADAPVAGKTVAAKPDKTAATAEDPAVKAAAALATDPKDAPTHWAQADKDKFNALAPDAKSFVLDRFKAMEGDYTRKTQAVAHLQKEYGPVNEMFTPHMEVMRQKGFTPRTLIESWANVEMKLAGGTDSAVDVIKGLVGGYNIPVAKIAAALGLTPAQAQTAAATEQNPTATQNGAPVALPPEIVAELKALRDSVSGVTSWKTQQEQQAANQRRAIEIEQENAVSHQVNEFKSAVDDKGSPLHPHFDEVEAMMTSLAQAALASKQPVPSLQQLYETAVYANPTTRDKVLTALRQQEEATRVEAARAKAASARRAGSSVTGAPGSGQAPSGKPVPTDTIRGSLEAAFDEVEA